MVIARSLKDAARIGSATTSLLLRRSEDLVCQNLMCAKLGEACLCRLAVHLSRLSGLRELDVAENDLGILPEPVFELTELETLDISGGFRSFLNNLKIHLFYLVYILVCTKYVRTSSAVSCGWWVVGFGYIFYV